MKFFKLLRKIFRSNVLFFCNKTHIQLTNTCYVTDNQKKGKYFLRFFKFFLKKFSVLNALFYPFFLNTYAMKLFDWSSTLSIMIYFACY